MRDPKKCLSEYRQARKVYCPHPVAAVGAGADGDDLAAQLPEAPENVGGGKKNRRSGQRRWYSFPPAPCPFGQNPENFVDDLPPVGNVGQGRVGDRGGAC